MTVNLIQNDFSTIGERSLADIIGKTKSTILKGGVELKKLFITTILRLGLKFFYELLFHFLEVLENII